jgi:hypothetical protein
MENCNIRAINEEEKEEEEEFEERSHNLKKRLVGDPPQCKVCVGIRQTEVWVYVRDSVRVLLYVLFENAG